MSLAAAHESGVDVSFEALVRLRGLVARRAEHRARADSAAGELPGRRPGRGLDIHDLRLFAEGDDIRHVDPAATARTGRLHVRTFLQDQDREALLVADFRPPMLWGTRRRLRSVAAAAALAIVGWRIVAAGGKVGLMVVSGGGGEWIAPQPRERAMLRIAAALERAHRDALATARDGRQASDLDTSLDRAGRLAGRGAAIVAATGLDDPGPGLADVAGRLARRHGLTLLLVRDAVESAPPRGAFPYLHDDRRVRWGRFAPSTRAGIVDRLRSAGANIAHVDAAADDAEIAAGIEPV